MIGLAGLLAMGGRALQIMQAESARFRQPTADLVFGEAPGWHQVSGQRIAWYGGFDYSFGQDANLRPGHQRDLHGPLEYLGEYVVEPDRGRQDEDSPSEHLGHATCGVAEIELLGSRYGYGLTGQAPVH